MRRRLLDPTHRSPASFWKLLHSLFSAPGERRAKGSSGRYNRTVMSIQVAYRDGVFKPLEEVAGAEPGAIYTAFSKEELRDFIETVGWLKAAEKSFEFWDNPADAVYDTL